MAERGIALALTATMLYGAVSLSGCTSSSADNSQSGKQTVNAANTTSPTTEPPAASPPVTSVPPVSSPPPPTSHSEDACLPITMPSTDTLFKSTKKVFAHYFYPFPLSIDNKPSHTDYYNVQYLNRDGESDKWIAEGGYLRQRPLGVSAGSEANWQQLNMQHEVKLAIARGITGFFFDVMSLDQATDTDSQLHVMMKAAAAVDARFKIIVMPDLTALKSDSEAVVSIIASIADSPSAYKLDDGRLVVSSFDAGLNSANWWSGVFASLKKKGIEIAFFPTFLGWRSSADQFAPISYGFGDWGYGNSTRLKRGDKRSGDRTQRI